MFAQGDDVPVPLLEVNGRTNDQVDVRRIAGLVVVRVGIQLSEDGLAVSGVRVDHHGRLILIRVGAGVGQRNEAGVVEGRLGLDLRDLHGDRAARAEPVRPVEVGRVDRYAVRVLRHRIRLEVQAPSGVRRGVVDREVVVREGLHAQRRIERITPRTLRGVAGSKVSRQCGGGNGLLPLALLLLALLVLGLQKVPAQALD